MLLSGIKQASATREQREADSKLSEDAFVDLSAAFAAHIQSCRACKRVNRILLRTDLPSVTKQYSSHVARRMQYAAMCREPELEAMLHPSMYNRAIRTISSRQRQSTLQPTIDCFASRANAQMTNGCMYIDRRQDFFSATFDCQDFWRYNIAWANPPPKCSLLKRTIKAFSQRGMHGFICGPQWPTVCTPQFVYIP